MKKLLFIMLSVLLIPASLSAQKLFAVREGKILAMGECVSQVLKQQANKYARAADMKAVAVQQTTKAVSALQALKNAYPEYAKMISSVIDSHDQLVKTAARQEKTETVLNDLTVQLAVLHKNILSLRQANEEVSEQAKQIINHEYWVDCIKEAVSMDKIKEALSKRIKNMMVAAPKPEDWLAEL